MTRKTLLVVAVLAALGAGTAFAAAQTERPEPPRRATLDKNGDGVIDRSEAAAHPRLAEQFDTLDKNKDGKLAADERPRGGHGPHPGRGGHGHGGMMKLDTDRDGRISKAEAAADPRFTEGFAKRDVNADGFLDRTDRQLQHKQRRDEWFAGADADKDGKLTRAEIDAADAKRQQQRQAQFQARSAERFASADTDKDGKISREEAKARPHLAERFGQLDADKDGALSQDELKARRPMR